MKFNGKFNAHQGDVELFSIDEIPGNAKKIEKSFFAKSEKSGHCHAMCGDYDLYEVEDGFVIEVGDEGCIPNHTQISNLNDEYWDKKQKTPIADHKPSTFNKGIYYVGIQKRKKHFSKTWERVID